MMGAKCPEQRALFRRAGGGENGRSRIERDLQRGQSDAARTAMDQDLVALAEAGKLDQGVVARQEGDGDRRRCFRREPFRHPHAAKLGDADMGRKGRRSKGNDPLAGLKARRRRSSADDPAAAFHAKGRTGKAVFECFFRQEPERPHDIAEIETARLDLDLDLTGRKRRACDLGPGEPVEHALCARVEPQRRGKRAGGLV